MIALESALTVLAAIVLGIGMVDPKRRDGRPEAMTAAIGFAVLFAGTFFGLSPLGEAFGGAWGVGPLSVLYKRLFLAAGALTALLACPSGEPKPSIPRGRLGEALGLMIFSVTGMCVLVSSRELALLYTGLELVTMPLVALVAFHPREPRGAEAGLKYVFTSALSSGFLLYGLSFVYGLTGTTMIAAGRRAAAGRAADAGGPDHGDGRRGVQDLGRPLPPLGAGRLRGRAGRRLRLPRGRLQGRRVRPLRQGRRRGLRAGRRQRQPARRAAGGRDHDRRRTWSRCTRRTSSASSPIPRSPRPAI